MEQWSMNKAVFRLMICYLLKRKSPLTNGIQPLIAKTDINFWTFLWTPIQAIKPGAHSLKFSCVLRVLFIEKKRRGMVWQATDLMVQIRLDGVEAPCPPFFSAARQFYGRDGSGMLIPSTGRWRPSCFHGSCWPSRHLLPASTGNDGGTRRSHGKVSLWRSIISITVLYLLCVWFVMPTIRSLHGLK